MITVRVAASNILMLNIFAGRLRSAFGRGRACGRRRDFLAILSNVVDTPYLFSRDPQYFYPAFIAASPYSTYAIHYLVFAQPFFFHDDH